MNDWREEPQTAREAAARLVFEGATEAAKVFALLAITDALRANEATWSRSDVRKVVSLLPRYNPDGSAEE